jgi:UDP-N-acetylmuramoylalanine--D-glutamate ligase
VIAAPAISGRTLGVYGLARSGRAVLRFLARSGARAIAWDGQAKAREGVDVELLDLDHADLHGLDAIVVSPGVPLNRHPLAARAAAAGVPVIGDIELFALARPTLPPHRVVGITGTNGKSTVTALTHHILETAGVPSRMGGNIGLPVLDQQPLPEGGVYVLELSSFQLDLTRSLACDVAAITNVTPDHLDRYAGLEAYAASKERLFAMQTADGAAVVATDDAFTRAMADRLAGRVTRVSAAGIAPEDQARWPALAGPHNAQNAAVATAIAQALGVADAAIEAGLASYAGLPHRMKRVDEVRGVAFVNDSKATNPTSAAPALAAFPANHWIAGGQAKTADLDACLPHLANVRSAWLIGEAGPLFAEILAPHVPVHASGTLDRAVAAAAAAAVPGDTVLLSPACASFDQFTDYEARGRAFEDLVRELPR